MHQTNQNGHFDQWADDGCKRFLRGQAKGGNGNGNGQLKIVACRRKRYRNRFAVIGANGFAHKKADDKHDQEIERQWHGNLQGIEWQGGNHLAFQTEHDDNRKRRAIKVKGLIRGTKTSLYQASPFLLRKTLRVR